MISCDIFKKKMHEYMIHNLQNDMERSMDEHLKSCNTCKALYEEELKLDNSFKEALSFNEISYTSTRYEILKSVNSKRYKRGLRSKIHFNFLKYKWVYSSVAALLIVVTLGFNGMLHFNKLGFSGAPKGMTSSMNKDLETKEKSLGNSESKKDSIAINSTTLPKVYEKLISSLGAEITTPWKISKDGSFKACVAGKGSNPVEVQEEGVGKIIVKYQSTGKIHEFDFINSKQYSPKALEWWDNKNLLFIYGLAYGTVSKGGDIYCLNIDTGNVTLVYSTGSKYKEVSDIKINDKEISVTLHVYDDDTFTENKSHKTEIKINDWNVKK